LKSALYRRASWSTRLGLPLIFFMAGCQSWQQRGPKGTGLLSKPAKDEKNFSSFQPANPYVQTAPGLLSRTVFQAPGPPGMQIEVRDLLIGPAQRTENVRLPGTQVADVRAGSGAATIDGQRQEIKAGSTFAVQDGKSFTIENTGSEAIQIRVYVIRAQ
jgi:quercetin dioxygenase-like cupin family protein